MLQQPKRYRGIDYQAKIFPGTGVTGWSAVLRKDGRPIMSVEGQMGTPDGRHFEAPVDIAVRQAIDDEFQLAATGQSKWGDVFT